VAKYFAVDYLKGEFELFSASHIIVLLTLILLNLAMAIWLRRTKSDKARTYFRYLLAAFLILQEISLNVWRALTGQWSLEESLPLHLCGVAIILSAIMLLNRDYFLYELTYFWGFGGAIQAILTPDSTYGFPHYRFLQVFASHGAIITASVYMTFVQGYRPTLKSIWKAVWITNAYTAFIALFNLLVGGNYLFICHKPETPSLLDYMGPWPWYILSLEAVGIISFFLYYAPFALRDLCARRKRTPAPSGA
jgi:hypothetical integral membrane protein (TIGR02206 family)